ncbi:MAG: O-antigen ligase family protein [Limisphaerales bacterium]
MFWLYVFFALSSIWSEYSLASIKRISKDFGCVLAALVLLTERDPAAAIRGVFVRVAYVLIPLSIVLIKYFPALGRTYSKSWEPMMAGVTTHKNSFGQMLFVFCLMMLWDLKERQGAPRAAERRTSSLILLVMLLVGGWLLIECNSRTSLLCGILGVGLFWGTGFLPRMRNPKQVLLACSVGLVLLFALESTFDISDRVLSAFGRNKTLTGRTSIWSAVADQKVNPLIGSGFCAFWDTRMAKSAQAEAGDQIMNSHNGYIDLYLDGGLVGCCLFGFMMLSGAKKVTEDLRGRTLLGRVSFLFWVVALVYNNSESCYFRLSPLWFALLLVMIRCPAPVLVATARSGAERRRSQQVGRRAPSPVAVRGL